MVVNDNRCELDKHGALESIASRLATGFALTVFPELREEASFCPAHPGTARRRPLVVSSGAGPKELARFLQVPFISP
jgi:hypothetical protein